MLLSTLRDKARIWFYSTAEAEVMNLPIEELTYEEYEKRALLRNDAGDMMGDPDHNVIREEVRSNREMIHNMRVRVSRIDERTAFQSKILFGLFLAIVGSIGAGLVIAFITGV